MFKKYKIVFIVFLAVFIIYLMPFENSKILVEEGGKNKPNSLVNSNNPYLLQHAYNPIEWREWNEETLQEAKEQDKLIFLSIGYSTCYWCHVMEREVFEHEDVAKLLKENFIAVKVDREERPDIDNIYITANMLFNGSAGWPNNVFLTPDLKPFFAHTYLDKKTFSEYIGKVEDLWLKDREKVISQAFMLSEKVRSYLTEKPMRNTFVDYLKLPDSLKDYLIKSFDSENGGFGSGTKFPREQDLDFLLEYANKDSNHEAFLIARYSLDKMANGGINDHIGGGFHRYTVDSEWKIPHFEKMLYNQANLLANYVRLYEETNNIKYKNIAYSIIDFVDEHLTDKKTNAFYSGLDAETDAVEGAYYVWSDAELRKLFSDKELTIMGRYFDRAELPNFPGHKHPDGKVYFLERNRPIKDGANKEDYKKFESIISKLKKVRNKRKLPRLDYKQITEWNGMMISSLAKAGSVFNDKKLKTKAVKAADFYLNNIVGDDFRLHRIYSKKTKSQPGVLADYAYLSRAYIDLYTNGDRNPKYLDAAIEIVRKADDIFKDEENGGFFFSNSDRGLFVREKGVSSSAYPSAVSILMHSFLDLHILTGKDNWLEEFEETIDYYKSWLDRSYMEEAGFVTAILRYQRMKKNDYRKKVSMLEGKEVQDYVSSTASNSKVRFDVKLVERKANLIKAQAILNVEEGWHINSNPASMEFLIPTKMEVRTDKEIASKNIKFPLDGKKINSPIGDINVLEGRLLFDVEIVLLSKSDELEKIKFYTEYQACNDTTCLSPSNEVKILYLNQ